MGLIYLFIDVFQSQKPTKSFSTAGRENFRWAVSLSNVISDFSPQQKWMPEPLINFIQSLSLESFGISVSIVADRKKGNLNVEAVT